jgi:hypothetical protein
MNLTQGQFQTLGIAILFCVTLIVLFGQAMNSLVGEKGLILKTEFVKSKDELRGLVGTRTEGVKNALLVDTIGFIPVYFLLFTLIIWFLAQHTGNLKYLAITAGISAIITIFFDLSENLKVFDGFSQNPIADPLDIASSAIGKWVGFFVTVAILSFAFLKPHYLTGIIAALLLLGSIIGLVALVLAKYELIQISVLSTIIGILIVGVSFTFWSAEVAKIFNQK